MNENTIFCSCIAVFLTLKTHLHNANVVKKFIFRYLDLPLNNDSGNILVNITNKNIPNKIIELIRLRRIK